MASLCRLLSIDLGSGLISREDMDASGIAGLGGKALGIALLERFLDPGVDPLSPGNVVVLASSRLAGYAFPGSNRLAAFAKSPLTGAWLECYVGGSVSRVFREAGWDVVVLLGASKEPCRIELDRTGARILPARDLWGLDATAAEETLLGSLGGRSAVLAIGPAGERLVAFASVMHEGGHALGRCGLGAVFGSKKLKAFSVVSPGPAKSEASEAFAAMRLEVTKLAAEGPGGAGYRKFGTPMMVAISNEAGSFPADYWSKGRTPNRATLEAEGWHTWAKIDHDTCNPCPMRCRKRLTILEGEDAGRVLHGAEYETLYAFGGSCGVAHAKDVAILSERCNRLGMDTISAANTLGMLIKAKERGAAAEAPRLGDTGELLAWLDAIAARKAGLPDLLARGMDKTAAELGVPELSIASKGLDPAGYEARRLKGMALSYALSPRGACHLRSTFYKAELSGALNGLGLEAYVDAYIDWEDRLLISDSLIMCRFYRDFLPWERLSVAVGQLAGREVGKPELQALSTDVLTRIRRLNFAMGLGPQHDDIPARFFTEATDAAPALDRSDFEAKRTLYWEKRGWGGAGKDLG